MQPQMPFFLGREAPPAPLTTTCQKVFRTPDIDEVGLDTYHLTFFEMLGNFSFGQYFKEGAIEFATEFIRERLRARLGPDLGQRPRRRPGAEARPRRGGDRPLGADRHAAGADRAAAVARRTSGRSAARGRAGPTRRSTATGARRPAAAEGCLPGCTRCERFLEFWNLVFMSYELHPDGTLTPLPKQNIDTGLGLERTARILQDVAVRLRHRRLPADHGAGSPQQSGVAYGDSVDATKAHRVLADHGRGMTFLVGEGVTPSNEGRGYVLRRIVRRAVQHGLRIGMQAPFLAGLAGDGDRADGRRVPGARRAPRPDRARPRGRGGALRRDARARDEAVRGGGRRAARSRGEDAFTLQATYGFPIELTLELARERGIAVDEDELRAADGGAPRDLARGRRQGRGAAGGRLRARRRVHHRVRRLGEDRGADADRRARGARRRAVPGQAARVAVLPGGRRPGDRRRRAREGRRLARRARARPTGSRTTRRCSSRARASPPATASRRSCRGASASRRWRTTRRRTSCTRRCGRCSASTSTRPARRCGRTSSASTSRTRRR